MGQEDVTENYYENGQLNVRRSGQAGFSARKPHGHYECYLPNGQLVEKGTYNKGTPCGGWIKVADDGEEARYTDYGKSPYFQRCPPKLKVRDEDSEVGGPYYFYDSSGHFLAYVGEKNGKPHGPFEDYYENGQLYAKGTYVDGKLVP